MSFLGTCSRITRMPCRSSTRSCGCTDTATSYAAFPITMLDVAAMTQRTWLLYRSQSST